MPGFNNDCKAFLQSEEPYTLNVLPTLLMGIGPLPVTWYENTLDPDKKTALPLALMQVKCALLLNPLFLKKISPSLPPPAFGGAFHTIQGAGLP